MNDGFIFVGDFEPDPDDPLADEPIVEDRYYHTAIGDAVVIKDSKVVTARMMSDHFVDVAGWR